MKVFAFLAKFIPLYINDLYIWLFFSFFFSLSWLCFLFMRCTAALSVAHHCCYCNDQTWTFYWIMVDLSWHTQSQDTPPPTQQQRLTECSWGDQISNWVLGMSNWMSKGMSGWPTTWAGTPNNTFRIPSNMFVVTLGWDILEYPLLRAEQFS